jgi:hypothetical protein
VRYVKTEQGQQVIKARTLPLPPRQRTLLLLCDGVRTVEDILATTAGMASSAADVDELLQRGLIEAAQPQHAPGATPQVRAADVPSSQPATQAAKGDEASTPAASDAEHFREAYQLATQLTSQLGLKGFRLQLAVESAMTLAQLQALLPRLSDALISAHGPKKGPLKVAQLQNALRGP